MVVPRNQAGFDRKLFPPIVKNTTPSGRSEYCRLVVLFEFIVIAKNILPNLFISHLKKLIEALYLAAGWFSWIVNTLTEPWKEEEERLLGRRLCWLARTRRVHTLFRKVKLQTVLYSKRFVNVNMARRDLLDLLEGCQFRGKVPILLTDFDLELANLLTTTK